MQPKEESSDVLARWKSRWDESRLGWHQAEPHPFLVKHGSELNIADLVGDDSCSGDTEPSRILFPLCGKTVDMAFLAEMKGVSEVVGVDGIRKALTEFIDENPHLEIKGSDSKKAFERFEGKSISLLKGDFFDIDDDVTNGKFDGIFDRGSIVAIQPSLREHYVGVMGKLLKPGGSIVMVTVDRREGSEEGKSAGPPFGINGDEINRLYKDLDWVESITKLDEKNEFHDEESKSRWTMQGVDSLFELVYLVKKKSIQ